MWQEIKDAQNDLDLALSKARERGQKLTVAEAHYYSVKDRRVRELMDDGFSASSIAMMIKGEPGVNEALQEFHDMQVLYKNACEAIQVYKRRFDFLKDEYQREWTNNGN